jgi:putative oxidoreductase
VARDIGLLILRFAGLYLALSHGWGKVFALSSGQGAGFIKGTAELGFPMPVLFAWAAALSEFLGGLLVTVGLGTRVAAAFAASTMAVAAFAHHHAHGRLLNALGVAPVSEEVLKGWGNPELALIYLLAFVAIACLGPGGLAIDARFGRKGRK